MVSELFNIDSDQTREGEEKEEEEKEGEEEEVVTVVIPLTPFIKTDYFQFQLPRFLLISMYIYKSEPRRWGRYLESHLSFASISVSS